MDTDHLAQELEATLRATLFFSGRRITPRRVRDITGEMATSFLRFLEDGNDRAVSLYGQELVHEGFSPRGILALAETVRRVCWEANAPDNELMPISGRFVAALLEGYMGAREAYVLQQQDQIRRAFERARDRTEQ